MFVAEVDEPEAVETEVSGVDKAHVVLAAGLVELDEERRVEAVADDDDLIVAGQRGHVVALDDLDVDGGVEVGEFLEDGLGAGGLADVVFFEVEVAAHVAGAHKLVVAERHALGPGEDEVLGDFDAEAADSEEEDSHGHELALGFCSVDCQLPG